MQIFAHRGFHKFAPENTIEAFNMAIDLGVDGIETDIRLLSDGVLALFHDRFVLGTVPISSLTRNELSKIVGYKVPTLEEALELKSNLIWNLEIKPGVSFRRLCQAFSTDFPMERLIITSFVHDIVVKSVEKFGMIGGFIVAHSPFIQDIKCLMRPSVGIIVWDFETLTPELIKAALGCGVRNFAYGATTEKDHSISQEWQLHGLITDHPDFLLHPGRDYSDGKSRSCR